MTPITREGRDWLMDRETEFREALKEIKTQNAAQLEEERKALRRQADQLDHRYRIVTYGLIVMVVILVVGGIVAASILSSQSGRIETRATDAKEQAARLADLQEQTRRASIVNQNALCALRRDLERRVASSEMFLRDHPHGLAGIPAATIRASTDGQRRTITALSEIRC